VQGQLVEVPIGHGMPSAVHKKKSSSARIHSLTMELPFWDDFSFVQDSAHVYPNDTLYMSGKSVWVNNGVGINPPTIYVATFDGIDSLGKPYNINEVLAKGFADKLISRPINLGNLPAVQNDSVHFSFFYQPTGKREAPDQDDNLSLYFKNKNGNWDKVFEVGNSVNLDPTIFHYQVIPVDNEKYFHENFQFKFQNFARLSGPYDSWNLDYIYLNKRRWDLQINSHDQAFTKPITSIFKQYQAIPIKHIIDTASEILISPKATSYNLYRTINNDGGKRSFGYKTSSRLIEREGGVTTTKSFLIDDDGDIFGAPLALTHFEFEITEPFPVDSLNKESDSTFIDFKIEMISQDDSIDDESAFYYPINFTVNDSISSRFALLKYYAYDDGTAEYGAGLNQPGGELAYLFDMFTKDSDTVAFVDIHWPEFGDNSSQNVILKFWRATGNSPSTEIYRQTIPINRRTGNQFFRYPIEEPVGVKEKFFIGWEHTSTVVVPVGLDKNTVSGEKIYYNTAGTWEQNLTVNGSLMIRPVFGPGKGSIVTGITDEKSFRVYPNPSTGEFYVPPSAQNISITNTIGLPVAFQSEQNIDTQRITVTYPSTGILVVRWLQDGRVHASKVLMHN
jgi:hypothetical protein